MITCRICGSTRPKHLNCEPCRRARRARERASRRVVVVVAGPRRDFGEVLQDWWLERGWST